MKTHDLIRRLAQQDSLTKDDMARLTSYANRDGLVYEDRSDEIKARLEALVEDWPLEVGIGGVTLSMSREYSHGTRIVTVHSIYNVAYGWESPYRKQLGIIKIPSTEPFLERCFEETLKDTLKGACNDIYYRPSPIEEGLEFVARVGVWAEWRPHANT